MKLFFAAVTFLFFLVYPADAQQRYTLRKALETARRNNEYLKVQYMDVGIARTDVTQARLRPNPILNNQTLQLASPSHFPERTGWYSNANRQVWWQLTQPFELAGQRRYRTDLATRKVNLEENRYAESERDLFRAVADKWLEVWTLERQLAILNDAIGNIDSLVTINRVRLKNLVITQTDLLRTELLEKQYRLQLKTVTRQVAARKAELQRLLGVDEPAAPDTVEDFGFVRPESVDGLLEKSLEKRSDIREAQSMISVAEGNIRLQKSLAVPSPELGLIYNPQNRIQYVGVYGTVELPLFHRNQGEIKKSYLLKKQAEQQLSATRGKLETEVAVAYAGFRLHRQNAAEFEGIRQQSEAILNSVRYSYVKGGTTLIDFLEAQRSWLETEQKYYDTLEQYHQSYIDLLYATGLINELADQ